MERRTGSRAGYETLQEYRERQTAELIRRQAPAMRRQFWADKAAQAGEGA